MNETWRIIIAERGWVYVGKVHRDGDYIVIRECDNVRRWGTARGLGELALEGPKQSTTLDYYGEVKLHVLACCGEVTCNPVPWEAHASRRSKR